MEIKMENDAKKLNKEIIEPSTTDAEANIVSTNTANNNNNNNNNNGSVASILLTLSTGQRVAPGDVLFSSTEWENVTAGEGCCMRLVTIYNNNNDNNTSVGEQQQQIIATKLGVVQWSESTVSVVRIGKRIRESTQKTNVLPLLNSEQDDLLNNKENNETNENITPSILARSTAVFGPRLGDTVHLRIVRVSRLFAYGEIIAVNDIWCSHKGNINNNSNNNSGSFRGVVRVEDIRPFKPTKDQLTPPPPATSFHSGDVVVAVVLSQSDVRQFQLSTIPNHCGVVAATTLINQTRVKLLPIAGRRDALRNPMDGTVHYRWCPLVVL